MARYVWCTLCTSRPYLLRGMTGLLELQAFLKHLRRRHGASYTLNDALRLRADAEEKAERGGDALASEKDS